MNTLIKAVEIWAPDAEGQLLELAGGLYGQATAFGRLSQAMCFGRGEGLPGLAWEAQHPILLTDLRSGHFQRTAAAKAAGLSCALAYPVFADDAFKAVVLFFCGDGAAEVGAVELWKNDPRVTPEMKLVAGYYGATHESFQADSRETYLQRSTGLPGQAWQRQASLYLADLATSSKFARAAAADAAGLQRGIALPCPIPGRENYVVSFLWSPSLPVARRIESWTPDAGRQTLQWAHGVDAQDETGLSTPDRPSISSGNTDAIGQAFATAAPALRQGNTPGAMLALPIVIEGLVSEVLALYF